MNKMAAIAFGSFESVRKEMAGISKPLNTNNGVAFNWSYRKGEKCLRMFTFPSWEKTR